MKVPLGDTRKGMLRESTQAQLRKQEEAFTCPREHVLHMDMEFFTDPVVVREGTAQESPMIVREHKPLRAIWLTLPIDFNSTAKTA
jgi:hypothetical protein